MKAALGIGVVLGLVACVACGGGDGSATDAGPEAAGDAAAPPPLVDGCWSCCATGPGCAPAAAPVATVASFLAGGGDGGARCCFIMPKVVTAGV